jgi:MoaA/NifB/PqqE/SkfB family radical SAM enzyme
MSIKPNKSYKIIDINSDRGYNSEYNVILRITEACDLQCSYCHWHAGRHYDYDSIIASIDKLFEFFQQQKYKRVLFYYHGGEATRHNKILDILKYIKQKSNDTGIEALNELQTNLTIRTEFLEQLLSYTDLLDISFHYLELSKRGYKLTAFDNNFEWLVAHNKQIHNFDVMMEDVPAELQTEFYQYIEKYISYPKITHSEMIYGFYEYSNTEASHIEFYNKHNRTEQKYEIDGIVYNTNDLFKNGLDCTGWKCSAGKKNLYVNGDGNAFVCGEPTTRFVKGQSETPYTNLITEPNALTKLFVLSKSGTICKWNTCGGDYYLEKTIT